MVDGLLVNGIKLSGPCIKATPHVTTSQVYRDKFESTTEDILSVMYFICLDKNSVAMLFTVYATGDK